MVIGWSMYEKLTYPYYVKNNKAFTLINSGKMYFFDCHWRFLPIDDKYIKNKNDFFVGGVERNVEPPVPLGE
jgi:hypothetical protein